MIIVYRSSYITALEHYHKLTEELYLDLLFYYVTTLTALLEYLNLFVIYNQKIARMAFPLVLLLQCFCIIPFI